MTTLRAAALAHVERRQYVLFCVPRGKLPLTEAGLQEHGLDDATIDPAIVEKILAARPDANLALACKASGFVVVDMDRHGKVDGFATLAEQEAKLGRLPETVEAVTGGGGRHSVFQAPAGTEFRGSIGPGVDIKHAGYILIEPSIHPSGRLYRWIHSPLDQMPASLPDAWLAAMLKPAAPAVADRSPVVRTMAATRYGRVAAERELERVRTARKGERNCALNVAACKVAALFAGGELEDCREELVAAGMSAGLPELEARATVASGWRAGLRRPRVSMSRAARGAQ
jgi:hypothetical protein